jgi:putative methanogenesis marker protein 8
MMEGDYVGFGASELLSGAIQAGLVDCAVIAGDGAGTVLAPVPSLVQGIGGRMSGLVKTSPHPEVIARIEARGGLVLDPATARIDQAEGVARAYSEGFGKVAVTVAGGEEARFIRKEFPATLIIAVHTTGVSREEAQVMADSADLVTACASRHIRDVAGSRALMQAGSAIPVFAMTGRGKEIILEKIRHISSPLLVTGMELPFSGNECPDPLV